MVNRAMTSSVLNTRVMRGADVYSDHYLVRTTIRMKLAKSNDQQKGREKFDIAKLKDKDTLRRYNVEEIDSKHSETSKTQKQNTHKLWRYTGMSPRRFLEEPKRRVSRGLEKGRGKESRKGRY
jgi:hypothetical protein